MEQELTPREKHFLAFLQEKEQFTTDHPLTMDDTLDQFSLDSLDMAEIVSTLEQQFSVEIDIDLVEKSETIRDLYNLVEMARKRIEDF